MMAAETLPAPDTESSAAPDPTASKDGRGRVADRLYRLTVEQYDAMERHGVLTKHDRIELIEGLLVRKMTKGDRHCSATLKLDKSLTRSLPPGWISTTESPLILARSEPEPDVMVVRGSLDDPFIPRPRPGIVALVVEVADSSYADDVARCGLFAEAGIPFYWIVHIPAGRVEVYSDSTGTDAAPAYRRREDYGRGARIPVVLDGVVAFDLSVDAFLPPAGA